MLASQSYYLLLTTLLLLALAPNNSWAISCTGCVDLDELNFDKTIVRFPYSLVKFDIAFPYGEKHEAFGAFSKAAHKVTDELLIATVGIKDYGELENKALGERFKVDDKNFPGIYLFLGNVKEYVQFPAHLDVTVDNLKSFISSNTQLYIGRDGCLKQFNDALKDYANKESAQQLALIAELKKEQSKLQKPEEQKSAKAYLLFMRKINEQGYSFHEEETKRLLRLKAGKVTEAKKVELQQKLNILEAFRVNKLTKATESAPTTAPPAKEL
ncbi:protein windbeutel [Scaptodrosophila lebanonensis]|uniref:Protein windbeutel n=1 Tax=Drosophila lebanonensis TaxID=7225 RepID=A0A6J2UCQ6_DROLE|nr:protein windbeutel [Scaptodrosophila lebanonensis]